MLFHLYGKCSEKRTPHPLPPPTKYGIMCVMAMSERRNKMTNRLLAVEFVRLWRHRAKPASEGIRRITERHRGEEEPAASKIME